MSDWLELELAHELRAVEAPDKLWERVSRGARREPVRQSYPAAWIIPALASLLVAGTLWILKGHTAPAELGQLAMDQLRSHRPLDFTSSDPAAISRWIQREAGVELRLPSGAARLAGASMIRHSGQRVAVVAYRVGDDSGALLVARAEAGREESAHGVGQAVWRHQHQVYALAFSNPGRAQAACLLCHTSL